MSDQRNVAAHSLRTTCPLDCPDTCALDVTIEHGRVTAIEGIEESVTDGFICSKVKKFARRVYHDTRIRHPMRRSGAKGSGQFEQISWDDAIREIVDRYREIVARWGGEAILPYHYGGSNGAITDGYIDRAFFSKLGASRLAKTICAAPTAAVATGMYGKMPGVAHEDYPHAKCIVIWGANPKASSIHLVPFLKKAKENGAFIVSIDPRRNFSDSEINLHLPIRPGTDVVLALSLIGEWQSTGRLDLRFTRQHAVGAEPLLEQAAAWSLERAAEVTGVSARDIGRLASTFASAKPAVIRCGWGVERNRNGGQAVAAILAIPAVLGKFGVRGGGYTMSNSGAARLATEDSGGTNTRVINMTQLGSVLNEPLEPPIKALFVYNCNPVATVPDQRSVIRGLERNDLFTVVFEQVQTDTAQFADIILPATTFLEHHDLRLSYGRYVVGGVRPVIAPVEEARSNPEVFAELGRAMGWSDDAFVWKPEDAIPRVASRLTMWGARAEAATFERGDQQSYDFPEPTPVQFGTVFPGTSDHKIYLTPSVLGPMPYQYLSMSDAAAAYPLALISPATSRMISSTLGEFNFNELWVTMHPDDAQARGIEHGGVVRVFNDLGDVHCRARVRSSVRPGVVSIPKGAWRKTSLNGLTSNALCPSHVNQVAGGACFNDARVEVAPIAPGSNGNAVETARGNGS